MPWSGRLLGWSLMAGLALFAPGEARAGSDGKVDYANAVKPLLRERCLSCHGALKQSAKLRLDTAELLRKGGDSGPAVVAGDPEASPLLERVTSDDSTTRMPPEGPPLTATQIDLLRRWVVEGATSVGREEPERDPREHWAFRPIARPEAPLASAGTDANPIDALLERAREGKGLRAAGEADPGLWLRRVTIDLTGLPPTRGELSDFRGDTRAGAHERVVERLLASPRYGERWGRHWMDVWRYSDWYGRRQVPDVWNSAPQIWRWRDWIVNSLNADKGYDRMVVEMLAADEVAPGDDAAAVATGYLARNWYALNPNQWMRDNVEHTGKAFLGLTFNCAHCHDHKYDPIRQVDYFRMRAFFEPLGLRQDAVAGGPDPGPFQEYSYSVLRKIQRAGMIRVFDKTPDASTWFYTGGDERNRDKDRGPIFPGVPEFLGKGGSRVVPVDLPAVAHSPALRPEVVAAERKRLALEVEKADATAIEARRERTASASDEGQLARDEAELSKLIDAAANAGKRSALQGRHGLRLESRGGRRILCQSLAGMAPLDDRSTLRFRVAVLQEGHVNLQLAKDSQKGLTASYLGFKDGKILAYRPGGTQEFEAGRYTPEVARGGFEILVAIEPSSDRARLTVQALGESSVRVDAAPIALNGWNPAKDAKNELSLDVQAGAVAVFDAIEVVAGPTTRRFDFEGPARLLGCDVVGVDGWSASTFGKAPGQSFVATLVESPEITKALTSLEASRAVVELKSARLDEAESSARAARSARDGFEARLAADRARQGEQPGAPIASLAGSAAIASRRARLDAADVAVLRARHTLAKVRAKLDGAKAADAVDKAILEVDKASAELDAARIEVATGPADAYSPLGPNYPARSTGRRRALAGWIASRDNPLTARVAINHIWMRHFQVPLVASVYDFGRNGAPPTHPELIDWLACELIDSGWSMKHVHRLIVTSRAYRMTSSERGLESNARIDPANAFLWRMNSGRVEAEVVRDALLACAGELDGMMGGQELETAEAPKTRRRALYYSCYPEEGGKTEFGALFDAPEAQECYRRTRSVVPQQSLALTNDPRVHDMSRSLARRLGISERNDAAFVAAAFETILSRTPSEAESTQCARFLERQEARLRERKVPTPGEDARAALVRALFNHNDFLTVR